MSVYIFGYGSLLNLSSTNSVLNKKLSTGDVQTVTLKGYERLWRVKDTVWFESIQQQKYGLFLDINKKENSHVNGILIKVIKDELENLKLREKNYNLVSIKDSIQEVPNLEVFTFISKEEHRYKNTDKGVYIPEQYEKMVLSGCSNISSEFKKEYLLTTVNSDLIRLSGNYCFINDEQEEYSNNKMPIYTLW